VDVVNPLHDHRPGARAAAAPPPPTGLALDRLRVAAVREAEARVRAAAPKPVHLSTSLFVKAAWGLLFIMYNSVRVGRWGLAGLGEREGEGLATGAKPCASCVCGWVWLLPRLQITKTAFETINCRRVEGLLVVAVFPSVECLSGDHYVPLVVAAVMLGIFVVGMPLFMILLYVR
jgi:hypothetical protein